MLQAQCLHHKPLRLGFPLGFSKMAHGHRCCLSSTLCTVTTWHGAVCKRQSTRQPARKSACILLATASHDRPGTASKPPHIAAAIFTGTYAVVFGIALIVAPKYVFGLLFGSETVSSGWIRVGGILFTLIGWQYLGTAYGDHQTQGALGFYRATVWSRMMLSVAFVMLVVARESPPGLLVLAAINLLGAVSMRVALAHSGGGGTTTTTSQSDGADTAMKM